MTISIAIITGMVAWLFEISTFDLKHKKKKNDYALMELLWQSFSSYFFSLDINL